MSVRNGSLSYNSWTFWSLFIEWFLIASLLVWIGYHGIPSFTIGYLSNPCVPIKQAYVSMALHIEDLPFKKRWPASAMISLGFSATDVASLQCFTLLYHCTVQTCYHTHVLASVAFLTSAVRMDSTFTRTQLWLESSDYNLIWNLLFLFNSFWLLDASKDIFDKA